MNVTFVCEKLDLSGGGSNFSLELMARTLSERGHEISILTMSPESNYIPSETKFNIIEPAKTKFGTRIGKLEKVYRSLQKYSERTDIFHMFAPIHLPAAGYFRKKNDSIPVVGRLNTYTLFCVNLSMMDGKCHRNCNIRAKFKHQDASLPKRMAKIPFYFSRTYIEPHFASALDRYFAISPSVKRIYTNFGIKERDISVVPNFYDPKFVCQDKGQFSQPNGSTLQILYVGHLREYKGVDVLIQAIARTSNIEATIVGDGDLGPKLRSMVFDLGINDRVHFEGRVNHNELPKYYKKSDIFVHPARWPEPFGRTVLESLQCGTPAIVSDRGAPPWIVGNAGIKFPPNDVERLAEILVELRDDPDRIAELQRYCQSRVNRFHHEDIIRKIEKEYERVAN